MNLPDALQFCGFPKMGRLSREAIITEKIDGTNAQIYITPGPKDHPLALAHRFDTADGGTDLIMLAGSRTRWITPTDDNYGFARWAAEHSNELWALGLGRHFGEWWGSGIQRGYGLTKGDKRWSLFNVVRWCLYGTMPKQIPTADPRIVKQQEILPACVGLVPILYRGLFDTHICDEALEQMRERGSAAVPGYRNPEGIVVFHTAANVGFKKTLNGDAAKSQ